MRGNTSDASKSKRVLKVLQKRPFEGNNTRLICICLNVYHDISVTITLVRTHSAHSHYPKICCLYSTDIEATLAPDANNAARAVINPKFNFSTPSGPRSNNKRQSANKGMKLMGHGPSQIWPIRANFTTSDYTSGP